MVSLQITAKTQKNKKQVVYSVQKGKFKDFKLSDVSTYE